MISRPRKRVFPGAFTYHAVFFGVSSANTAVTNARPPTMGRKQPARRTTARLATTTRPHPPPRRTPLHRHDERRKPLHLARHRRRPHRARQRPQRHRPDKSLQMAPPAEEQQRRRSRTQSPRRLPHPTAFAGTASRPALITSWLAPGRPETALPTLPALLRWDAQRICDQLMIDL